jgi:hypothetical protein
MAPRQPKKSSPKKKTPKKATTPRQTKKSSPTRKTPTRATAKNTTTTTETVPPTQLLATAANSGDEPGTTQQLAEGTGDAATLTVIQKMQQELLALRQEKEDNAKKILSMAQGAAQHIDKVRKEKTKDNKEKGRNETAKVPKGKQKAPTTEQQDDNTTIEDSNIDYTIEKNYSVKRFIGHTIKMRGEKGPPIIQLQATWKGYEGGETTLEPWGKMKKHHSRQLKRYVNRNPDLKEVTETYQLFNKLAVGGKSNYNQG